MKALRDHLECIRREVVSIIDDGLPTPRLRDYLECIRAEIVAIINDGLPTARSKKKTEETRKRIVRLYHLIEEAIKTIDNLSLPHGE